MTRSTRTGPLAIAAALALTLSLAACGTEGDGAAADPTADPPAPTSTPAPTTTSPSPTSEDATMTSERPAPPADGSLPTGPVEPAVESRDDVQQAVADEAERMDVAVDQVSVAGYADVTWRDGSIGCPGEGRMYTQALVPGHQLILEVDGELASYHAAEGKPFKYCAEPTPPYESSADS